MRCWSCGGKIEQFAAALGVEVAEFFPDYRGRGHARVWRKPVSSIIKTYPYVGLDGELLYEVCRMEPKTFRQRRPMPGGADSWAWSLDAGNYRRDRGGWIRLHDDVQAADGDLQLPDVERVLYRLPELDDVFASNIRRREYLDECHCPQTRVFISEGEKDVDALWALGLPATTNAGGAGKWLCSYSAALTGQRVVILPDNDIAGINHAISVMGSLLLYGCESVTICRLPVDKKGDVSDFLASLPAEWTAAQRRFHLITEFVDRSPTWGRIDRKETNGEGASAAA